MGLHQILSRLSHEKVYLNKGSPNVLLKDLLEEKNSTFLADTSCLTLGFNFLRDSFEYLPLKEEGLHHVHGQIKALNELGGTGRLKILPQTRNEYDFFYENFTKLLMQNRFKYHLNKNVDMGLFQLYSDTRDFHNIIDSCVDENLEEKASLLYNNDQISSQLIHSYAKGNEIVSVHKNDHLVYLAGIISHNSGIILGHPTYILTGDIDFLVQPTIESQGNMYSVPIYFPSTPVERKLRNDTFSKYEHQPKNLLFSHSFMNYE